MGNCEKFPSLCHFLYRMEVRNLSDNYILWEDVAQYPGHGVEKDSRWQRISKGKVKYIVTQDLEWPSGSLTVVGKSPLELHCVIPILTGSHSILKCRRMLLLETKDVPETPYSCSQKSTTYSVWSYSQVAVCSYRPSLLLFILPFWEISVLRLFSEKILLWHVLLLQVSFYVILSLPPHVQSFSHSKVGLVVGFFCMLLRCNWWAMDAWAMLSLLVKWKCCGFLLSGKILESKV